jgi:cytidylate kinase
VSSVLGRASTIVLAEYPNALRVRLDGPLDARIAQAMAHEHLDEAAARKLQSESDRARDAYARHLYGTEMTDPSHFHLYVDATAIDIDTCEDLLETWSRRRLPAGASHPVWLNAVCLDGHHGLDGQPQSRKEAT